VLSLLDRQVLATTFPSMAYDSVIYGRRVEMKRMMTSAKLRNRARAQGSQEERKYERKSENSRRFQGTRWDANSKGLEFSATRSPLVRLKVAGFFKSIFYSTGEGRTSEGAAWRVGGTFGIFLHRSK